ncbi:hypothetical protein MEJ65_00085 [Candidatus Carsonella ruddii]|uniref:Uncharacterized protein n=1 Tax=Carsonella ruddii TaxID=114186 RepID=A0AAJ6JYE8_CARRU|nr:hypothetical protein [Candidatus Carsonella ruddii]WGS66880.1 hypothetical protein MEJ62_00080 [Candidatus Carsonella ruddii]WGS67072.1 hypothetical protein MEJ60_00080 [Candidatus Carsonella ruddii]WGS67265.1 hypothetical protein MEJ65_00085 [Candidatus Carsonella ruddii]WMC18281.1 MAG: hypothetical protein NU472_00085 [Candidatus Carsonella ruddii]WMC18475.1 MAG: hypothetical protein NU470_00085 [Candidatus Carsonella ruddii]
MKKKNYIFIIQKFLFVNNIFFKKKNFISKNYKFIINKFIFVKYNQKIYFK